MRIFGRWPYGTCSANWEGYQEAHGVTQIWERLYLGSIWDAQDLAKKNPLGITMVVTLCEAGVIHRRRSVNYFHVPIDDNPIDDQPLITIAQYNSIMDEPCWKHKMWHTCCLIAFMEPPVRQSSPPRGCTAAAIRTSMPPSKKSPNCVRPSTRRQFCS